MCGRYTLTRHEDVVTDLQVSLDGLDAQSPWWRARYNVAPTQPAPVAIRRERGDRVLTMMRWGLMPFWVRDPRTAPLMINARAESLHAKQWFRDALATRRCLVAADGFFEWRHGEGRKATALPVYFHPARHRTIAFAGLWATNTTDAGIEQQSFAIITGKPNALVAEVHDRMPVVLAEDAYDAWLDPAVDGARARELLGVPEVDDWIGESVSTYVNKWDHDDPQCVVPVAR
jgi:putative SOS response-associated peptidase YedK